MQNLIDQFDGLSNYDEYDGWFGHHGHRNHPIHVGNLRGLAQQIGHNIPAVAAAEALINNGHNENTVYEVLTDMVKGHGSVRNVDARNFIGEVEAETNHFESECFDSDSFNNEMPSVDDILSTRAVGRELLAHIDRFNTTISRKTEASGKDENILLHDTLAASPEALLTLQTYVRNRGYEPADNVAALAAQFAHARNEHINEKIDHYDSDGFSLRSSRRRKERQERKMQRIKDRNERRRLRKEGKLALDKMEEDANADGEKADPISKPKEQDDDTAEKIQDEAGEITNPSTRDAHAEILGEEFGDSYDGQPDNFLPFLAGALRLGTNILEQAQGGQNPINGGNVEQFRDLFRKKSKKKLKALKSDDTELTGKDTIRSVTKAATDKVMSVIEKQRKKDFLKENAPMIVVGLFALLVVGSMLKK